MERITFIHILIGLIIFFFCHKDGLPQIKIQHSVLANGGATIANNNFRLQGTVGQPLIGLVGSASESLNAGFWYLTEGLLLSVEQTSNDVPLAYRVDQNYPNPFNPTTTIEFALPENSNVTLKLFDILGRNIATLVDDKLQPGVYKVVLDTKNLSSGVYFYRLWADKFVQQRKLILIK